MTMQLVVSEVYFYELILDKENNGLGLVKLIYCMLRHSHPHGALGLYSVLNTEVKIKQMKFIKL